MSFALLDLENDACRSLLFLFFGKKNDRKKERDVQLSNFNAALFTEF